MESRADAAFQKEKLQGYNAFAEPEQGLLKVMKGKERNLEGNGIPQ